MNDLICRIKYFLEDHRITLPRILAVGLALAAAGISLGIYFISKTDYDRAVMPLTVGVILAIADLYGWYGLAFYRLGRKNIRPEPQTEFIPARALPKMRFNFPDELVREELRRIADSLGYSVDIDCKKFEIFAFGNDSSPKYGYSAVYKNSDDAEIFYVLIDQDCINIQYPDPTGRGNGCYSFMIFDDFMRLNYITLKDEYKNLEFEDFGICIWEGDANPLSDREIFAVIENIMLAVDGTACFDRIESRPADLYRKHYQAKNYIFHVSRHYAVPDEKTVDNFQFIINGGIKNV